MNFEFVKKLNVIIFFVYKLFYWAKSYKPLLNPN